MRLDAVLSQASSGLDSINAKLSTIAQNIANANTAGYVVETLPVTSAEASGDAMGVRTGVATRTVDVALQADLFAAGGQAANSDARQTALQAIDQASGTPGSGQDLASLVGALRDAFSTLQDDPSNQTQQRDVVNKAAAVASGVNALGQAVGTARQGAQDGLVDDVAAANTALQQLGQLSDQVIAARSRGVSTADLEDKRDAAMQTVTQLTGARFLTQANGGLLAVSGGTVLPLGLSTGPLAIASAAVAPGSTGPALTVSGVAAPIAGGRIGAELDLRDTVLPAAQAKVDGFASSLAGGFAAAGLTLFTDSSGTVPGSSTGFAQTIQVSPAVRATPSQVRDGAGPTVGAGNTTLISALLGSVLASGAGTIAGQATDLVAGNASAASAASSQQTSDQALEASLKTKLDAGTGVSVDSEMTGMVQLQNSYGANAKVIAAVQSMWTQLLATIT